MSSALRFFKAEYRFHAPAFPAAENEQACVCVRIKSDEQ